MLRSGYPVVVGLLLLVALVTGCATGGGDRSSAAEKPLFFPTPPVPPRIQYLTWASGVDQVEPGLSGFQKFLLAEEEAARPRINKPFGIAARDGVVYVCDTKAYCIWRMDFKNRKVSTFGDAGPGTLRKPMNIVVDPLGFKFVADPVRNEVVIFGPDDKFVRGYKLPEPSRVVDMAIWKDELYVLDNDKTPQIVVLDRTNGEVKRSFPPAQMETGSFRMPVSIGVGSDGSIYLCDSIFSHIQKLSPDGKLVWGKGGQGYLLGQFGRPRSVRVGPDGVVYIVDAATAIVQMWNEAGEVLMHFGGPGSIPGSMMLPASLAIDKTSLPYFKQFIHKDFKAEYLLFVANQYGPILINVYAFGSFPEGYEFPGVEARTLPRVSSGDRPDDPPVTKPPEQKGDRKSPGEREDG